MFSHPHYFYIVIIVCIIINIYGLPIQNVNLITSDDAPIVPEVTSMVYIDRMNTNFSTRQHVQIENNQCNVYISPLALFAINQTIFFYNSTSNLTMMIIPLLLFTNEQIESLREDNSNKYKHNGIQCSFHKVSLETIQVIKKNESEQPNLLDCYNRYVNYTPVSSHLLENQRLYVTFECTTNEICLKFEESLHKADNDIGLHLQYTINEPEEEQMIISDKHLVKTKIHLSNIILAYDVDSFLEELLNTANIQDNHDCVLSQSDLITLKKTLRKQFLGQTLILTDTNNQAQWNSVYWNKMNNTRPDRILKLLNEKIQSKPLLKDRIINDFNIYNDMDNYAQHTYNTEDYNLYLKYRHLFELQHRNSTQGESISFLKLKPILAYQLNKFNRSRFLVHQPVRMTKRDNIYLKPIHSILPFMKTQPTLNCTDNDSHKLEDLQRIIDDLKKKLANYETSKYDGQTFYVVSEDTITETPERAGSTNLSSVSMSTQASVDTTVSTFTTHSDQIFDSTTILATTETTEMQEGIFEIEPGTDAPKFDYEYPQDYGNEYTIHLD